MLQILGQSSDSGGAAAAGVSFVFLFIWLAVAIAAIAGMWKAFEKAGQPGWAAIIPFYNWWVMIKIVGRESWWFILLFIPCVNFVVIIVLSMDIAKSFGKDALYGIGLWLLPVIFWPMLGFGDSQYRGPAAAQGTTTI